MAHLRWLDAVVIAIYMVAMVIIGLRFARRQTSTEAYFVAQRSIPSWALGISIYAALISSITFIAYPGSAYAGNWNELVPGFMVIGVLVLVGLVIIPFFRQAVGMSAYEFFGRNFSYKVRAYSALAFTLGHFSKMGFVFYALALTVTGMTGWNIYAVMIVTGIVTIFYTVIGGLEAVIWTDVIQGFIKCIGIFICIGFLLYLMPGGPSAAFHLAWDNNKFSLGTFSFDLTQKSSVWVMTLYGFFWYMQKFTADQTLVQRYLVARTDREALKGVALGALLCVPAWTLFMLIGTLVWAYYKLSHDALPALIDKPDKVFPYFLTTKIPAGLAGLFMSSLFASAMSMLSSDLNCLSVVGVEDYYRKLRPNATDKQRLRMGKLIVAACGVLSVIIAVVIAAYSERVLSLYYMVTSIIAGGLAGLFLLAFLNPRANKEGVYIGIAACLAFTTWGTLTSGSSTLAAGDIKDIPSFTLRLKEKSDPVSEYLLQRLSKPGQQAIAGYPESGVDVLTLQSILVKDLNKTLEGESLYEQKRFEGLSLRPQTKRLIEGNPQGKSPLRLNRLLLEDAYPHEITRNQKDKILDLGSYNFTLHPVMIGVIGHLVLLLVGCVASLFFAAPDSSFRKMTLWGWLDQRRAAKAEALAPGLKK